MSITLATPALGGGWEYHCGVCKIFFSVQADEKPQIKHCPACGRDALVGDPEAINEIYNLLRRAS
jgi:hypothetical protein